MQVADEWLHVGGCDLAGWMAGGSHVGDVALRGLMMVRDYVH